MRILFVSSSSGSHGGGEIFLTFLGRALAARGHRVALWASDHSRMDLLCEGFSAFGTVLRSEYRNIYDRRSRSLWNRLAPRQARELATLWTAWNPDVIHLNKQNLEDGLDLLRLADQSSIPSLCTIHLTQPPSQLGAVLGRLRDFVARRALARYGGPFIVLNQSRADDLLRFAPLRKPPVLIGNGVVVPEVSTLAALREKARRDLGLAPGQKLVIGVGRFVVQKRPLHFLDEAVRIHAADPQARFLWIGAAPEQSFAWVGGKTQLTGRSVKEEWDERLAAIGLASSVQVLGWQKEVVPYLAAADLYLHTAAYEGLPFSLLEAMAAALPVAVSAELSRDLGFLNEGNSLRLDPGLDWTAVLQNGHRLSQIGNAARALVQRDYSMAAMAVAHEELYRSLGEPPR